MERGSKIEKGITKLLKLSRLVYITYFIEWDTSSITPDQRVSETFSLRDPIFVCFIRIILHLRLFHLPVIYASLQSELTSFFLNKLIYFYREQC